IPSLYRLLEQGMLTSQIYLSVAGQDVCHWQRSTGELANMLHNPGCIKFLQGRTHEICQMYVPIRIQENIVWLNVPVDNALAVYIFERTCEFCDPEFDCFFRKGFPRNVETEITAVHQVNHEVSARVRRFF